MCSRKTISFPRRPVVGVQSGLEYDGLIEHSRAVASDCRKPKNVDPARWDLNPQVVGVVGLCGYESCGQSAFAAGSGERGAASSVRVSLHCVWPVCDQQYLTALSHGHIYTMADPHSAPASRRPVFGPGAWAAPSSGFGGRPASANPAALDSMAMGLRWEEINTTCHNESGKVFVKRRRPLQKRTRMFDRRRHAMEISTSDHISVRRRSRSRVTASVASAAVPPRARGCVSMWGSPTSRHATSARARASSNHAACASLLRWSLSLARALSPSSSRPSRRAAPQLAGTLLYRLLY